MTKRKPIQQRNPHNPLADEQADTTSPRSALNIIKDSAAVESYLRAERESWDC